MTQDELASRELLEKTLYFLECECRKIDGAEEMISEIHNWLSTEPVAELPSAPDSNTIDLHDYFAGLAMQSLIATADSENWAMGMDTATLAIDDFGLLNEGDVTESMCLASAANQLAKRMVHLSLVRRHAAKK